MNFKATGSFSGLNLAVIAKTYQAANRLSVEQSAEVVLEEAEALVPVDIGDLRESGHTEIETEGNVAHGYVVFDSDHAAYVEFGTGIRGEASAGHGDGPYDPNWPGMAAQPYARPALDTARPAILEIFRDNVALASKTLGRS